MNKNKSGSSSVLLLLIFLSLIILVSTFVNAAGYYAGKSYARAALDLAGRSVLAEYFKPLYENYGLFALKGDTLSIEDKLFRYAQDSFSTLNSPGGKESIDVLGLSIESIAVDLKAFSFLDITAVENQILEQMKYRLLIPRKQQSQDAEEISQGLRLVELGQKAFKIIKRISETERIINALLTANEQIRDTETQMKEKILIVLEEKDNKESEFALLKGLSVVIRRSYAQVTFNVRRMEALSKELVLLIEDFDHYINGLGTLMNSDQAKALIDEVGSVKKLLTTLNNIANPSYESAMQENIACLNSFENTAVLSGRDFEQLLENYNWDRDISLLSGFQVSTPESDSIIDSQVNRAKISELTENDQLDLNKIQEDKRGRVLRNERVIDELPSILFKGKDGFQWAFDFNFESLPDLKLLFQNATELIIINEYVISYFTNHLSNKKDIGFFNNEVEYILFGNMSDDENFAESKRNLLILRASLNMMHIYSNAEKRSQVSALALALTPGPWSVCTELAIITAWASIEAKEDLRVLESGGSIELIKKPSDWATDLETLLNSGISNAKVEKNPNSRWQYEDYLRLFLTVEPRENKLLRLMDIVQLNMISHYDQEFAIKDYYHGFNYHAFVLKRSILPQMSRFANRTLEISSAHLY